MGRNAIELTGRRFGNLTVQRRVGSELSTEGAITHASWLCRCDCGGDHVARGANLAKGVVTRCRRCAVRGRTEGLGVVDETVVDLWYYAAGEAGGFAVARDMQGAVLGHTPWSKTKHKLNGPAVSLVLGHRALGVLAKAGRIRERRPSEGYARWAKAANVSIHARLFTPMLKLHQQWYEATGEWRGAEDGIASPGPGYQIPANVNLIRT